MYDDGFWLFAGCDGFYQPAQPDFEQTAIQSVSRILVQAASRPIALIDESDKASPLAASPGEIPDSLPRHIKLNHTSGNQADHATGDSPNIAATPTRLQSGLSGQRLIFALRLNCSLKSRA